MPKLNAEEIRAREEIIRNAERELIEIQNRIENNKQRVAELKKLAKKP